MYPGKLATTTESRELIGKAQWYSYIWTRRSHTITPILDVGRSCKGKKKLCNKDLEVTSKEIKWKVSAETLLNYAYWKATFTVHRYASDIQLGAFIIQNKKRIIFFSSKSRNPQINYIMKEK